MPKSSSDELHCSYTWGGSYCFRMLSGWREVESVSLVFHSRYRSLWNSGTLPQTRPFATKIMGGQKGAKNLANSECGVFFQDYSLVVSNPVGSTNSIVLLLTVSDTPPSQHQGRSGALQSARMSTLFPRSLVLITGESHRFVNFDVFTRFAHDARRRLVGGLDESQSFLRPEHANYFG